MNGCPVGCLLYEFTGNLNYVHSHKYHDAQKNTHGGIGTCFSSLFFLSLFLGDGSAFSHVLLVAFQNPGPNDVDVLVL